MQNSSFKHWAEFVEHVGTRLKEIEAEPDGRRLVAIIFGSDGSKLMKETIINRYSELNFRSGNSIDIYIVGWTYSGEYKQHYNGGAPKLDSLEISNTFSPEEFSACVNAFHERLTWRYSGEVDLILMDAVNGSKGVYLDERYAIALNLQRRTTDGTILSVNSLLESLIEFAKSSIDEYPIQGFVKHRLIDVAASSILESLVDFSPKGLQRLVKNVLFMRPIDLGSKSMRVVRLSKKDKHTGLGA